MKIILSLLVTFFISSVSIAKTFTFLFTEGKDSRWSVLSNWSNNEYPQNLNSGDAINIFAPDNTKGWVCRVDTNFTASTGGYFVGPNVQLLIDKNKGFRLEAVANMSSGHINVAAGGEMVINGYLSLDYGSVQSYGPVTINGGIGLGEGGNLRGSSSLSVNALLKINGGINSLASHVYATKVWVASTGSILLQQGWDLGSSFEAGDFIHEGSISTMGTQNQLSVDGMQNKGEIILWYGNFFRVNDYLENTSEFTLDGELNLNGSFINTGSFYAIGRPSEYSNTDYCTINGSIINSGRIFLDYANFSLNGHFVNDSSFFTYNYDSWTGYFNQTINWNLSGINNGNFRFRASLQMNQPFINLDQMRLYTPIDSTRINSPFINEGALTCYGPIALGEAFINKGELKLEPLEAAPPTLMEATIKQKGK